MVVDGLLPGRLTEGIGPMEIDVAPSPRIGIPSAAQLEGVTLAIDSEDVAGHDMAHRAGSDRLECRELGNLKLLDGLCPLAFFFGHPQNIANNEGRPSNERAN